LIKPDVVLSELEINEDEMNQRSDGQILPSNVIWAALINLYTSSPNQADDLMSKTFTEVEGEFKEMC